VAFGIERMSPVRRSISVVCVVVVVVVVDGSIGRQKDENHMQMGIVG
jgi:hypothetical protein